MYFFYFIQFRHFHTTNQSLQKLVGNSGDATGEQVPPFSSGSIYGFVESRGEDVEGGKLRIWVTSCPWKLMIWSPLPLLGELSSQNFIITRAFWLSRGSLSAENPLCNIRPHRFLPPYFLTAAPPPVGKSSFVWVIVNKPVWQHICLPTVVGTFTHESFSLPTNCYCLSLSKYLTLRKYIDHTILLFSLKNFVKFEFCLDYLVFSIKYRILLTL